MARSVALGVRWTIGDVSERGFHALRLSVWGAYRVFGPEAAYVVCANNVPLERAQALTGELPDRVEWRDVTTELPAFLRARFDERLGEGVGWKFAPLRCFPGAHELSLDNDCILWEMPTAIARWLDSPAPSFVIAEDVRAGLGAFTSLCTGAPRNSGIRGLPPGFDLERALRALLELGPQTLTSELDEQGLQVALVERSGPVHVVSTDEVSICSPFYPHQPHLGRCGAHFVGLNARQLPFEYFGRPATECRVEHWEALRPVVDLRVSGVCY